MPSLDSMPTSLRVKAGKEIESEVMDCLNTSYSKFGYDLIPSSTYEDTKEKTDCWQLTKSGKRVRSAIKGRFSKNDILIAMRDPFYGFEHEGTNVGRDVLYEYFQYITLSKDKETIRVASGKAIHTIYKSIWQELLDLKLDINMKESPYNKGWPLKLLRSEKHEGCEIWLHFDRFDGHPKLLGFIPPSILKEGKEIKYHKFV